jgi:hypothetical protein
MPGTGVGKSRNSIHKPIVQKTIEFHPLDRLPPFTKPLPDTTIDRLFKPKSQIAEWNSNASSNFELALLQIGIIGGTSG